MKSKDVLHQGGDNIPGLALVKWAYLEEIDTLPAIPLFDTGADQELEDLATISANIVMKEGNTFKEMYVTLETGAISTENQGSTDCRSVKSMLKFFHPGTKAEILGFERAAQNGNLVFIVTELDGKNRLFGHKLYPAKLEEGSGVNGPETSGQKGQNFGFMSVAAIGAPIFTGKVDLVGSGYGSGEENDFQLIGI